MLSLLVLIPLVGGLAAVLARKSGSTARGIAVGASVVELALAVALLIGLDGKSANPQYVERFVWIPSLGAQYHLAADGVTALMLALTSLLALLALVLGWDLAKEHGGAFAGAVLFLVAGVNGAFAARDLLLFFMFWEAMLVPMYLLVALCGGPRRAFAATKFFIYTTVGSLLMLVAIISLYLIHQAQTGAATFDLVALAGAKLGPDVQVWLFLAFALAFAIKVPLFPFHSWIGDLYTEAPLPALVLSTMLVKVGAYGMLRYCVPLFPDAARQLAPLLITLAVIGIIYGGIVAATQPTISGVMAYSSVAQLGFIVLGVFALNPAGFRGAVIHMVNHGVSAGALFAIGAIIMSRTGTVRLAALGGLGARWPLLTGAFTIALFSAAGLPGLNGFIGEYLVLLGAYQSQPTLAVIATAGVVISAIYLLRLFRKSMHGPQLPQTEGYDRRDLGTRELVVLTPLLALAIWVGLFPNALLDKLDGSASTYLPPAIQRTAGDAPASDYQIALVTPK